METLNFCRHALLLNILLFWNISWSGAVLTSTRYCSIVLTIGISVDANVLIFERVREELDKGKEFVNQFQTVLTMLFHLY